MIESKERQTLGLALFTGLIANHRQINIINMWDKGYIDRNQEGTNYIISEAPPLPDSFPTDENEIQKFWQQSRKRDKYISDKSFKSGAFVVFLIYSFSFWIGSENPDLGNLLGNISLIIIGLFILSWVASYFWKKNEKKSF